MSMSAGPYLNFFFFSTSSHDAKNVATVVLLHYISFNDVPCSLHEETLPNFAPSAHLMSKSIHHFIDFLFTFLRSNRHVFLLSTLS